MKKNLKYLIIVLISFFALSLRALPGKVGTTELYMRCMRIYIQKLNSKETTDTLNIINNEVVYDLPDHIGNYRLKVLNDSLLNKINIGQISINAVKLFPIKIENDKLMILLADYNISKDSNGLVFGYAGGASFYFQYDCAKKEYIYLRSKTLSF